MKPTSTIWILFSLLCFAQPSLANDPTYYEFHPQSIMSLGLGFSVSDLTQAKSPCVEYVRHPLETGSLSTEATIRMVSNTQELRESLSMDASVDVSYLMFKGSSHFSFSQENLFSAKDINFVLKFSNEYARIGMQGLHLTQRAQMLLDKGDVATFKSECGTRLVLIEHRGATVAAIVTLHEVDSTSRSQYAGSLSGGINLGALSGDMKASIAGEMDRAARDKRISVQVVSTGGDGFGALSTLVSQDVSGKDVFGSLQQALGNYIKGFNNDNAAPIGFSVGPMLGLTEVDNDLWSLEKERRLGLLVDEYRADAIHQTEIDSILAGRDPRADLYSETQLKELKTLAVPLDDYMNRISQIHSACKGATVSNLSICRVPEPKPIIPKFLQPISPLMGQWFICVDGVAWSPLKSRTFFEDPGGGTILERVRRRLPNAKSAAVVFSVKGRIVDEELLVGVGHPLEGFQVKVFYPDKTKGDALVAGNAQMALVVGSGDSVDVDPIRTAWAHASFYHCLPPASRVASAFRIFVKVRDEFGQLERFEIATSTFSTSDSWQVGGPGLMVWLPIKEAQYYLKIDPKMPCHDAEEFYMGKDANADFKSALDSANIGPYPAYLSSPEFNEVIERILTKWYQP
ncbi:hypothetical protein P8935_18450 [Telmatobacter sp. DSM 110680]|uniref:Uncharacterized protein n=1 Tax=Telmatobacter sp. DSM 110680 TaxID=3036704 RepID=A0AAU7DGT5_9BACT